MHTILLMFNFNFPKLHQKGDHGVENFKFSYPKKARLRVNEKITVAAHNPRLLSWNLNLKSSSLNAILALSLTENEINSK